jgi:hypothetical protein
MRSATSAVVPTPVSLTCTPIYGRRGRRLQQRLVLVEVGRGRLDDEGSAVGHRVARVHRQIHQDLLHQPRAGLDHQREP